MALLVEPELTGSVIGAAFADHRKLGFGFRERVYAAALQIELHATGHRVAREFTAVVHYDGLEIARERLDMVVDEKLIVEIKSTERLHRDARRQLYNYLRATNLEIGPLLHFGRSANVNRVIHTQPAASRNVPAARHHHPRHDNNNRTTISRITRISRRRPKRIPNQETKWRAVIPKIRSIREIVVPKPTELDLAQRSSGGELAKAPWRSHWQV